MEHFEEGQVASWLGKLTCNVERERERERERKREMWCSTAYHRRHTELSNAQKFSSTVISIWPTENYFCVSGKLDYVQYIQM